jgi:hypothetical protein
MSVVHDDFHVTGFPYSIAELRQNTVKTELNLLPKLLPHHQLETGPHLGDRAHLDVNQAERKR